jgi:hypothetical protein
MSHNYKSTSIAFTIAKVVGYTQSWRIKAGQASGVGVWRFDVPLRGISIDELYRVQKELRKIYRPRKVTIKVLWTHQLEWNTASCWVSILIKSKA